MPILKRKLIGKRLLAVSRKAESRITTLALVYRIGHNKKYLNRLTKSLNAVCNFSDWHPAHFLDVAEMSYAVAVGIDWCGKWLPKSTVKKARYMIRKHLLISLKKKSYNWWADAHDNWNQVCNSGLSAAALVIADKHPNLAAKIISRAVKNIPIELAYYSPDGAYPEGPTYWGYGTTFNLIADSFFKSAFGTNFNLPNSPGFMQSATYRLEVVDPQGKPFNYSDASIHEGLNILIRGSLAWFAQKTGNSMYLNQTKFLDLLHEAMKKNTPPPRFAPVQLIWISEFKKEKTGKLPTYWYGKGYNPIAIFRADKNSHTGFYLGVKGGSASVNHGNMDVGSFVFDLHGVRWSIDPGTHSYHELEENKHIGEKLWDESQNSPRWSLLTKGNQFHSTLTVDGKRHNVNGFAPITKYKVNNRPEIVELNLSGVFKGQLNSDIRTFKKINDNILEIEDNFSPLESTKKVTWQMMTQASVTTTQHGAILRQDGKELNIKIIQPANANISVISLNPPPLAYDKKIKRLKRIDITLPYYMLKHKKEKIIVKLEGE